MSNDPQYDAEQQRMQSRYLELIGRYTDKPFATRHTEAGLEAELSLIQEAMLAHPPLCECETEEGKTVWLPRKPGIRQEPQLPAEQRLEMQSVPFRDSGIKVLKPGDVLDIIRDPNRTAPRAYVKAILDQNGYGSCSTEGYAGGIMERRVADGQEPVTLNPLGVYGKLNGGRDSGSNPREVAAWMQKYGCTSEAVRPRSSGWRAPITEAERIDALQYRIAEDGIVWVDGRTNEENWWQMVTLILSGFAVPFGYQGHWIFADDVLSLSMVDYTNSWGRSWGDQGHGSLSKSQVYWPYGVCGVKAVIDRRAA